MKPTLTEERAAYFRQAETAAKLQAMSNAAWGDFLAYWREEDRFRALRLAAQAKNARKKAKEITDYAVDSRLSLCEKMGIAFYNDDQTEDE